eukprot:maker-scaffold43_size480169-snap-gene-1.18 protein:Tk12720 transcript:maker-scaffold43_size480169-snap-gene-1.18-mRNA-1 annotation:"PREDICTED: uncharacterized protein LOC100574986 isoform X3"
MSSSHLALLGVLCLTWTGVAIADSSLNLSELHEFHQLESVEGSGDFSQDFLDDVDFESSGALPPRPDKAEMEEKWFMNTFGRQDAKGKNEDIHFEEEDTSSGDSDLYEYYSEYYEEDYDDEDEEDDEDDEDDDDELYDEIDEEKEKVMVDPTVVNYESSPPITSSEDSGTGLPLLSTSYLYIMLATALISFALGLILFFVCRRSVLERRAKQKMVPFVLSASHHHGKNNLYHQPSPIVKNYQRVPTSTQEFLQSSTIVDMKHTSEKPLLPHINPHYLADEDRPLGRRPAWPQPTGPWSDQERFRCHLCGSLGSHRAELKAHLPEPTRQTEAVQKGQRPEDFEETDTRPGGGKRPLGSCEKENSSTPLHDVFKLAKKRRLAAKAADGPWSSPTRDGRTGRRVRTAQALSLEPVRPDERRSSSAEPSPMRRPERKCTTTTNALVLMSLEDETLDISFEDPSESEDDKPLVSASLKRKRKVGKVGQLGPQGDGPPHRSSPDPREVGRALTTSADTSATPAPGPVLEQVPPPDADRLKHGGSVPVAGSTPGSTAPKLVARTPKSNPQRRRRKRPLLTKKPRKSRPVRVESDRPKDGPQSQSRALKRVRSPTMSHQTDAKENVVVDMVHAPLLEELLPDLVPNLSKPRTSKRSISDAEKAAQIVKALTETAREFKCLACFDSFEYFPDLFKHKLGSPCATVKTSSMIPATAMSTGSSRPMFRPYDHDFVRYMSESIHAVPETTFNSLHGTIHHIDSLNGLYFRSKASIGTLERVKMNINAPWTTKDVWGSGSGWEISRNILSWHKFESAQSPNRKFLHALSTFSWHEQHMFKVIFDQSLAKNRARRRTLSPTDTEAPKKRSSLLQGLDLKQLGRSVKYMSAAELEERKKQKPSREYRYVGDFNGEWENEHMFMCSVCAQVFDDVTEVMHHKWDAHPYCLVAHVTMQAKLHLPPNGMMYPKLGRNLLAPKAEVQDPAQMGRGKRASKSVYSIPKTEEIELKCTKCETVLEDQAGFHAHILVCGGLEDWDVSGRKKKKRKSLRVIEDLDPEKRREREEAATKRKARFAKFDQPPPVTGRNTRFQKVLIKKTKIEARINKTKKKRGNGTLGSNRGRSVGVVKKSKGSKLGTRGKSSSRDSPLPDRPRRSTVNYARDQSLRDMYDNPGSSRQKRDFEEKLKQIHGEASVSPMVEHPSAPVVVRSAPLLKRRASVADPSSERAQEIRPEPKRRASCSALEDPSQLPEPTSTVLVKLEDPPPVAPGVQRRLSLDLESSRSEHPSKRRRMSTPSDKETGSKVRVTLDESPTQLKDLERLPSVKEEDDSLSDIDEDKLSTDSGASSSSTSSRRRKRRSSPSLLIADGRSLFPKEVKINALQRILDGETQAQVARDLQCPMSTVSTWWKKRDSLLNPEKDSKDESDRLAPESRKLEIESGISSPSPGSPPEIPMSTTTAIVPYRRNELLQAMKTAFRRKSLEELADSMKSPELDKTAPSMKSPELDKTAPSSAGVSLIVESYGNDEQGQEKALMCESGNVCPSN